MAVNKVVINETNGERVLIDLTEDSVTPETLSEGVTAHDASGNPITGTMPTDVVRYGAQTLTEEQKAQARENIGAASSESVDSLLYVPPDNSVLGGFVEGCSLWNGNWQTTANSSVNASRAASPVYYDVRNSDTLHVNLDFTVYRYGVQTYDVNKSFLSDSGWVYTKPFVIPTNAVYIRMTIGRQDLSVMTKAEAEMFGSGLIFLNSGLKTPVAEVVLEQQTNIKKMQGSISEAQRKLTVLDAISNPNIRAIAHRGYSAKAPENTLAAYRLARLNGFRYAECDVGVTSDGVPVLLHDSTVDRTLDGTGTLSELTLEEVKAMDFGSWFSSDFEGEKIPTLEEFIVLCKRLGLHPYIELKSVLTTADVTKSINVVKACGMIDNVTWISFSSSLLDVVKDTCPKSRLGFVVDTITDTVISWVSAAKEAGHDAFIDAQYSTLTSKLIQSCISASVPVEVWTINSESALVALDKYVTGYNSDSIVADLTLYNASIFDTLVKTIRGDQLSYGVQNRGCLLE